ncbi:MAG: hypothetical protein ABFC67_06945 [Mizugakiibacter sp.]|uniref:hypothetical protein n=1 Tax=Mizugakiibacter sp. TaxID=1972610 RepID=UPI0031BFAA17|nr:hypothetical protein [Xanthomonadaceae bacterium]
MDKPLSVWYCDTCGEKIDDVGKGYVIWRSEGHPHDFKVIHQRDCDQKDHTSSAALKDFLGPQGLSYCMTFLSAGPIIHNLSGSSDQPQPNLSEFADFVRRVQVPYYEQARRSFANPELLSDFSDWNEFGPYIPDELERIARDYTGGR